MPGQKSVRSRTESTIIIVIRKSTENFKFQTPIEFMGFIGFFSRLKRLFFVRFRKFQTSFTCCATFLAKTFYIHTLFSNKRVGYRRESRCPSISRIALRIFQYIIVVVRRTLFQ